MSGVSTPIRTPRLMSSMRGTRFESDFNFDGNEPVFKVPSRPSKKIKRESLGF